MGAFAEQDEACQGIQRDSIGWDVAELFIAGENFASTSLDTFYGLISDEPMSLERTCGARWKRRAE